MFAARYSVPKLNRRQFAGASAAAAFGAAAASAMPASLVGDLFSASPEEVGNPLLSVMLWTIDRALPFERRVAIVADAGFHAVELVGEYDSWSPSDLAQARRQFQQLGMVVDASSGIHASLCDPAQTETLLQQIRAKLPVFSELGCTRLILLTGNVVPGLSHEQMHTNCVEDLKRAADVCTPQNVEILLENIDPEENPKYFLTSVTEGFQIVREVNLPGVQFLYDFYHEQISEGNLIAKLDKNLDLLGLVHIADVPGRHAPGTGEINYGNIYRKLGQLDYRHYIAMEFLATGDPVVELRTARELAQKCFAEGRRMKAVNLVQEPLHASA
jgi:hydroxypyruvate isomerase